MTTRCRGAYNVIHRHLLDVVDLQLPSSARQLRTQRISTHVVVGRGLAPLVDVDAADSASVELGYLVLKDGCTGVLADDKLDRPTYQ